MSENWDFFFCNVDDEPASIFVDLGIADEAPIAGCSDLVWLRLRMNEPNPQGLSSNEEYEKLTAIEDALVESTGAADPPIVKVGRCTSDGHRDFFFYTGNATQAESILSQAMVPFPDYEYEIGTRPEEEWETYYEFLFPDERSLQDIFNRRLLMQLEEAGDLSHIPRNVDHWVVFAEMEHLEKFRTAAAEQGFTESRVEENEEEEDSEEIHLHLVKSHAVDYETVSEIVMQLFDLAEEHDGFYDGWGCELVTQNGDQSGQDETESN